MSARACTVPFMSDMDRQRAHNLGLDHAEAESNGEAYPKLYSGKQVASALSIETTLGPAEYVALRDSYQAGFSAFW